ncbi:MAG: carboxypeptidase regulatory-like domain-containing protein [Myxococcaceae bacterium]
MKSQTALTRALALAALAATAACGVGPEGSAAQDVEPASLSQALGGAPVKKVLTYTWQGQQTGYWCGPGSTRIALSSRISPPSQTTLANYMGTTTNGTNHIGLIAGALNHYLNVSLYSGRSMGDPPSSAQRDALKLSLVATVSNGYPLVANVVSGWRPPGYPGGTIYHYVAVVGYDLGGDRALIADPAGGCAVWCGVPASYWISTYDLGTWIGGKGYAGTSLPINPGTTTGTLLGAIYQGGSTTNRVSGATVSVSGHTATTAADGLYQFQLAPGTYTVSVAKAGYGSNSASRTVTAGAQTWGSMEINTQTADGALKGKIYAFNAQSPSDMSQAISGAVVSVAGQSQTTGADGMYAFTLAAGTHTVSASKSGYANASVTRAVAAGATVWGSVGLTGVASPDVQAPQVAISSPSNDAQLDLAVVTLTGTASDDRGPLAEVEVTTHCGGTVKAPVVHGKFSLELTLAPGANPLTVSAKDGSGNVGTATSTATFNAGLGGIVYGGDEESQRVTSATVELFDAAGTKLAGTVTGATGAFALELTSVPLNGQLVVTAPGFRTWREGVSVPADRRLQLKIGLVEGTDEPGQQVSITLDSPRDGETVAAASVTVRGLVAGFAVASVTARGVQATVEEDGHFTALVPLSEGENLIEVVATGTLGETAKASLTVIRASGSAAGPEEESQARGGCSATGVSASLWLLLALLPAIRRRRQCLSAAIPSPDETRLLVT